MARLTEAMFGIGIVQLFECILCLFIHVFGGWVTLTVCGESCCVLVVVLNVKDRCCWFIGRRYQPSLASWRAPTAPGVLFSYFKT